MNTYAVTGGDTNTANTTQLGVTGGAFGQVKLVFLAIGSVATPADNAWEFFLQRYTAAGTSTAVTPVDLGPLGLTSNATAGVNHSVEPTYTANKVLLRIASNMRPGYIWCPMPGSEIWIPSTANNGVGLLSNAASATAAYSYTIHFCE